MSSPTMYGRGHFEGEYAGLLFPLLKRCRNAWERGVPIVKMCKNALWTALRTIFRIKYTKLHDFAYTISKFFREVIPPDLRKRPGAWIPISAWLVCVPTVPVFTKRLLMHGQTQTMPD